MCVYLYDTHEKDIYIYIIMYVCVHEYIHMDLYSTVLGNVQTQTKDRII